jgi:hypothetical protein
MKNIYFIKKPFYNFGYLAETCCKKSLETFVFFSFFKKILQIRAFFSKPQKNPFNVSKVNIFFRFK